jgi:hypothetical protein
MFVSFGWTLTRVQSIIQKPRHAFAHITWGSVHESINRIFSGKSDPVLEFDQTLLHRYLKEKTSGYDSNGKLTGS